MSPAASSDVMVEAADAKWCGFHPHEHASQRMATRSSRHANFRACDDGYVEMTCVTVDCRDPQLLADFWADALGWAIRHVGAGGAFVAPEAGALGLEFIVVPEPKTSKNRVHVGCRTDDIDAEVTRLVARGATIAWEEEFPDDWPYRNLVLRDPEGNEFCLGNEPRRS